MTTTTSVLSELGAREAEALRDYRHILRRDVAGTAEPGDPKRLEQIMAALSLSAADVRVDAGAMHEARRLETAAGKLGELETQRNAVARSANEWHDETKRIEQERDAHQRELSMEGARLDIRIRQAREQQGRLVVHKRNHARLFGGPTTGAAPPRVTNLLGAPRSFCVLDV